MRLDFSQQAADAIRAAVNDLNAAVQSAERLGLEVRLQVHKLEESATLTTDPPFFHHYIEVHILKPL